MKKITLLLMLMVASVSFGQLKTSKVEEGVIVGKVGPLGSSTTILEKFSDVHILSYKDYTYPNIEEWKKFEIANSEINDLYDFIIKGFEEKRDDETFVELKNAGVSIKFIKALGMVNVQITHWLTKDGSVKGLTQAFTKKQIDKLFGKK